MFGKMLLAVAAVTSTIAQAGKVVVNPGGPMTPQNKAKVEVLPLHSTVARDLNNHGHMGHPVPYGHVEMNVPGKEKRKAKRKQARDARKRNR